VLLPSVETGEFILFEIPMPKEPITNSYIRCAHVLMIALLAPVSASAALISSDMKFIANTLANTGARHDDTGNVPNNGGVT
jgi:hypothetical protein